MAKSAKENLLSRAEPRCQRVAEKLQVELVDVEQVKDAYGVTLRVTIDRPEGLDLDGCERYHKALIISGPHQQSSGDSGYGAGRWH